MLLTHLGRVESFSWPGPLHENHSSWRHDVYLKCSLTIFFNGAKSNAKWKIMKPYPNTLVNYITEKPHCFKTFFHLVLNRYLHIFSILKATLIFENYSHSFNDKSTNQLNKQTYRLRLSSKKKFLQIPIYTGIQGRTVCWSPFLMLCNFPTKTNRVWQCFITFIDRKGWTYETKNKFS